MRIIGSYNQTPFSWLIRKATGSKASHIAFVWDDTFVVHSTALAGVNISWLKTWKVHHDIAWAIDVPMVLELEEEVFQSVMPRTSENKVFSDVLNTTDNEGYDYPALSYWFFRGLLKICLKIPMPKSNKWASPSAKLCVGLAKKFPAWLIGDLPSEAILEMTTPDKVGEMIRANIRRQRLD